MGELASLLGTFAFLLGWVGGHWQGALAHVPLRQRLLHRWQVLPRKIREPETHTPSLNSVSTLHSRHQDRKRKQRRFICCIQKNPHAEINVTSQLGGWRFLRRPLSKRTGVPPLACPPPGFFNNLFSDMCADARHHAPKTWQFRRGSVSKADVGGRKATK